MEESALGLKAMALTIPGIQELRRRSQLPSRGASVRTLQGPAPWIPWLRTFVHYLLEILVSIDVFLVMGVLQPVGLHILPQCLDNG